MDGENPVRARNDRGHANNVAHFDELVTRVQNYGAAYNPKNTALQTAALIAAKQNGRTVLQEVDAAIDNRKDLFDDLSGKVSGSLAALKVSGVSEAIYESAAQLARKITGGGSKPKPAAASLAPGETPAPTRSTSQMGYDNRVANFDAYVTMLESIADYDPNEAWLKSAALRQFSDDLFAANQTVSTTEAGLESKRNLRDLALYTKENNLVDTAQLVKEYVKSVFGASSPEYRQMTKLTFVNYDKD
jgi:hypothetical protein